MNFSPLKLAMTVIQNTDNDIGRLQMGIRNQQTVKISGNINNSYHP